MRTSHATIVSVALAAMLAMGSATVASAHGGGGGGFGGGHGFGGGEHFGGFGGGEHFGGGGMPFVMHGGGFASPHFGGIAGPHFGGFGEPHMGGAPFYEHFHGEHGFGPRFRHDGFFFPYYFGDYDDDYDPSCADYRSYNPYTGTYIGADGRVHYCP
jgi:BA14K-like protein